MNTLCISSHFSRHLQTILVFYIIMEIYKVLYSRLYNTIQIACARYNEPAKQENHKTSPRCCHFSVSLLNVCNTPDVPTNANNPMKPACGSQHEESAWVPSSVCHLVCETDVELSLANEDGPFLSPRAHSPCFQPVCTWLPAPKRQGRDCVSSDTGKLHAAPLRSFMQAASKESILLYGRTTPRK